MNRAAELLSGGVAEQLLGKPLEDVIGLVDETDRRRDQLSTCVRARSNS